MKIVDAAIGVATLLAVALTILAFAAVRAPARVGVDWEHHAFMLRPGDSYSPQKFQDNRDIWYKAPWRQKRWI